jgi:hypothetical protein
MDKAKVVLVVMKVKNIQPGFKGLKKIVLTVVLSQEKHTKKNLLATI